MIGTNSTPAGSDEERRDTGRGGGRHDPTVNNYYEFPGVFMKTVTGQRSVWEVTGPSSRSAGRDPRTGGGRARGPRGKVPRSGVDDLTD
ncbi:unnamed protein product [Danaus chrysippus]|uniref:(African queen) hypothetical protein n=1 Tax=Danaus chrysippus TaxID=151541 RepID=A0A8J2R508_9NEOP|nr:unnamed protein product [Danaus chrysippus]